MLLCFLVLCPVATISGSASTLWRFRREGVLKRLQKPATTCPQSLWCLRAENGRLWRDGSGGGGRGWVGGVGSILFVCVMRDLFGLTVCVIIRGKQSRSWWRCHHCELSPHVLGSYTSVTCMHGTRIISSRG